MIRWERQLQALVAFVSALALQPCHAAELKIRWATPADDPSHTVVEVSGIDSNTAERLGSAVTTDADWQRILPVRVAGKAGAADAGVPSMAGSYRFAEGVLRFTPQFPLTPGVTYVATLKPPLALQPPTVLESRYQYEGAKAQAPTRVAQIYPSASTLPENLLKFYICFSAPMSRGKIYEHIRLLNAKGEQVELPFLELDEELWNPGMTRLTLFIDPGRIKRGVRPLEEIGPALVAGERFSLVIDISCRDAAGQPLAQPSEKQFTVGPPEREPIDPSKWVMQAPPAGTRDPLQIDFLKPLDHAIISRVLRVKNTAGDTVAGSVQVDREERSWKFVPNKPWSEGAHSLVVPKEIEDLAGNSVGKAFDVDLTESPDCRESPAPSVQIGFSIIR